jgi:hypothetical protein
MKYEKSQIFRLCWGEEVNLQHISTSSGRISKFIIKLIAILQLISTLHFQLWSWRQYDLPGLC